MTLYRLTQYSDNFGFYFKYFTDLEEAKASSEHEKAVNYVADGQEHTQITEFVVGSNPETQEEMHAVWSEGEIINDYYFI
jgi:hypothetical protein